MLFHAVQDPKTLYNVLLQLQKFYYTSGLTDGCMVSLMMVVMMMMMMMYERSKHVRDVMF